jgi:tripartite-type tricarboxylate transporter receptor subunit TctC
MACLLARVVEENPGDDSIAKTSGEDLMAAMRTAAHLAVLCAGFAAASLLAASAGWAADNYPDHKVRMIVPFAAGGPTDVIGRMVAERLSADWGQQLYVENQPGAGGNIGVETVKRADPDGYTIVVVSTGFIINPSMYSRIGYDPIKDFAPISLVAASPNVVVVHPSVPAKNLKELIALIKADPSKFSYAQPATGSTPHLVAELMKQSYDLPDLTMVPFTGAPLAINSTLGNHTPIAFTALPPAVGAIKDGSLRGIALLAKQRVAALPDLPTNVEEGMPGLESDTLTGILAPAGTPQAIIDKWHSSIVKMIADPEVRKKLDALGFVPVANTPAEFSERIKTEAARWDKVVKAAGIHMD